MIFGKLNPEKVWHENLEDLFTSHATLPWEIKKVIFKSIIRTYFWLTLTFEMLNFFLSDWRFVSFFLIRASCGLSLVAVKRTGCGVATGMSQQVFRVTTFCISTCFQSFSTLVSHVVHHAVLKVNPCRKKSLPQASTCPYQYTSPWKMTFFGCHKVKRLHLTGEVDKSVRCSVKFAQDLTCQSY